MTDKSTEKNTATDPEGPVQALVNCQCDLRTRLVGDGCSACNPTYWKTHEVEIEGAEAWHQGLSLYANPYSGTEYEQDWRNGWSDANDDALCS